MTYTYKILLGTILLAGASEPNPDLKLQLHNYPKSGDEVVVLYNLSAKTIYTATVRRREYRKQWRVNQMPDGSAGGDTVVVKLDTINKKVTMVMPPRKWRWVGREFEGLGYTLFQKGTRVDTGHTSVLRFRIMSSKVGGDVTQMKREPEPFVTGGGGLGAIGAKNEGFFYGNIK